jgi:hypothetical protein
MGYRRRGMRGLGETIVEDGSGYTASFPAFPPDCIPSGSYGPPQPGQVYCDTGTVNGPGLPVPGTPASAPVKLSMNMWLIGGAVGLFVIAAVFGGGRR